MRGIRSIGKLSVTLLILTVFLIGCKSETKSTKEVVSDSQTSESKVIEVVTRSMEFYAPDTIPSGWNTFVYKNLSTEPHFILLDKYPEGKSIADMESDVLPPFDEGMALLMERKNEEAMEAFGKLPEWFSQIVFSGGTGLVSPQRTGISYVKLDPGYYIMECYVKMPDGKFHTSMGMRKVLIVKEEDSGNISPDADIALTISSINGISFAGDLTPGKKVFSVTYEDQIVHENFVGHDVNLVLFENEIVTDTLETWMNWSVPKGLMSATLPKGITFLGGTNDAPAGSILYFEAVLEAGNYAFIAEVPNTVEKEMFKRFSVIE